MSAFSGGGGGGGGDDDPKKFDLFPFSMAPYRSPSNSCLPRLARSLFPILDWLPAYNWRRDAFADVMSGFTVAVMHIPQGMAYAMLASVDPIVGIYTSFFPVLVYILMGTAPHTSFGTFAVASLMVSKPVREFAAIEDPQAIAMGEATTTVVPPPMFVQSVVTTTEPASIEQVYTPVQVATAVAFAVGILQVFYLEQLNWHLLIMTVFIRYFSGYLSLAP